MNFWPDGMDYNAYQPYLFNSLPQYRITTRPSLMFPDNFTMVYADGTSEMFFTAVQYNDFDLNALGQTLVMGNGTDKKFVSDVVEMERRLNLLGQSYSHYTDAMKIFSGQTPEPAARQLVSTPEPSPPKRDLQTNDENTYEFDVWKDLEIAFDGEDSGFGYKMVPEEGYAVLKIQGFSCYPNDAVEFWKNMTMEAKAQGIKKLMVDISWNGGGNIVCGNAMSVAMYQYQMDVDFDPPQKHRDIMDRWENAVKAMNP